MPTLGLSASDLKSKDSFLSSSKVHQSREDNMYIILSKEEAGDIPQLALWFHFYLLSISRHCRQSFCEKEGTLCTGRKPMESLTNRRRLQLVGLYPVPPLLSGDPALLTTSPSWCPRWVNVEYYMIASNNNLGLPLHAINICGIWNNERYRSLKGFNTMKDTLFWTLWLWFDQIVTAATTLTNNPFTCAS